MNLTLKGRSWLAVCTCALAIFSSGALFFGYPGIMTPIWQEMFQVDSGQTGFIMTFACIGVGIMMFVSGSIHSRIGTRKCMAIGTGIYVIALVIANLAKSLIMIYLFSFLVGAGSGFVYGPGVSTVQKWMPKRRGLASGILNLAFGIAAAIMSPVYSALYEAVGYFTMNWIIIGIVIVLAFVTNFFVELPEYSKISSEMKEELARQMAEVGTAGQTAKDFTPKAALKTKAFWMLWLCWAFVGAAGISMVSLSGKFAISAGFSGVVVLTAFNLTNGIGRFFAGTVSDIIGRNATCFIAFILGGIGYLALPFITNEVLAGIAAALVGLAFGTLFAATAARTSDLFGMEHYSMILALIFSGYGLVGGIAGPAFSGMLLTASGENYKLVFSVLGVFCLLGAVFVTQARHGKTRTKFLD